MSSPISDAARQLHNESLVWDMVWPWEPWEDNDFDKLIRFHELGTNVLSVTIAGDNHNISEAIQRIGETRRLIRGCGDFVVLCDCVDEIEQAYRNGKLAVFLHFEGTRCFERNLDMIETYYRLGIKHTLLAFNNSNSVGSGCMEKSDGGLTNFGRSFVKEMNHIGMLLDLSHTGHRTAFEAMDLSTKPCTFNHCNSAALWPHPRNVSDEEVKACAQTGGLVGVSGSSMYHGDLDARAETLFRHLDHFVELVGPDHVGLGIDIVFNAEPMADWMRGRPEEWPEATDPDWRGVNTASPKEIPRLTEQMLNAGYDTQAIKKILGENYLRICREVWT